MAKNNTDGRSRAWPLIPLGLLLILFENFWMWDNASIIFGLPANLLYHITLSVLATLVMLAITRWAWPDHLDEDDTA